MIRWVIQTNEVASPRVEVGAEAVRYLQRYTIQPSLPPSKMEGPFGTEKDTVKIMSFDGVRVVGCRGSGHEPHDLLWMQLKRGEKLTCNECGQVYEIVDPELEVHLIPYDPIDGSPLAIEDFEEVFKSAEKYPSNKKGYMEVFDSSGKLTGTFNTNRCGDLEEMLMKFRDGSYMENIKMPVQYPALHCTKATYDAFMASHSQATANVKDADTIAAANIKLMEDEFDIMAKERPIRETLKKEVLAEIEKLSSKTIAVEEPPHAKIYFNILEQMEADVELSEEDFDAKFRSLLSSKFDGPVDIFMHKVNTEVLELIPKLAKQRHQFEQSDKLDEIALQMGVSAFIKFEDQQAEAEAAH